MTVSADTSTVPTPSLVALAKNILRNAALLQSGLDVQPTFSSGGRDNYHDLLDKPDLMEARSQLIEASKTLLKLTLGPIDVLRSIITTDRTGVAVLRAIHELKIAESVPPTGSITIDALASSLGAHPTPLRRILGFAHTMGIFHQPTPNSIAHTSISAAIPTFAPYIWLHLSDATQVLSSSSSFAAASRLPVWPTPPVTLTDPLHRDFWTLLQSPCSGEGEDGTALFSAAMKTQMHSLHGLGNHHLLNSFPWAELGADALVVDVGGGNGHNAVDLARAFPNLRVVVQDMERNAEPAGEVIAEAGVEGRVTFRGHDFFTPQPEPMEGQGEVRVFLLSRILHDWPDEECLLILSHLVEAMKACPGRGVKILLMERVLPDRAGDIPLHEEAQIRALDLLMFTTFGAACERSRGEWQALLKRADEGLVLEKVTRLEGSELSILEVGLERGIRVT